MGVHQSRKRRKYIAKRSRNAANFGDVIALADYKGSDPDRFIMAFVKAWPKLPDDVRAYLSHHWRGLQSAWDMRSPRVKIKLPVVFVNVDPANVAIERGYLLGKLLRAREWNNFSENFMQLDARFAASHLLWFEDFDEIPRELATIRIAMTLANYYLCIRNRADPVDFITAMSAEGAADLAAEWGFDANNIMNGRTDVLTNSLLSPRCAWMRDETAAANSRAFASCRQ